LRIYEGASEVLKLIIAAKVIEAMAAQIGKGKSVNC